MFQKRRHRRLSKFFVRFGSSFDTIHLALSVVETGMRGMCLHLHSSFRAES